MKSSNAKTRYTAMLAPLLFSGLANAETYIVSGHEGEPLHDAAAAIMECGGEITHELPEIAALIVESELDGFYACAQARVDFRSIIPDFSISGLLPDPSIDKLETAGPELEIVALPGDPPPAVGGIDLLYPYQWPLAAIDANGAWERGATGKGVNVAILDNGIAGHLHDYSPNFNYEKSTSWVGEGLFNNPGPYAHHGTMVTGILAAAADMAVAPNNGGIIGVAPEVSVWMEKVLKADGTGSPAPMLLGLLAAVSKGADIVNMSFHVLLKPTEAIAPRDIAEFRVLMARAFNYAHEQGVTLVVAAGNEGVDLDGPREGIAFPCELPHAICTSATGASGWLLSANPEMPIATVYSNTGRSAIDLSAPGGAIPGTWGGSGLSTYDMVLTTIIEGWAYSVGTSLAAPHVAGVAALVLSQHPDLTPAEVAQAIRLGLIDAGQPGKDKVFGAGHLNANGAVQ